MMKTNLRSALTACVSVAVVATSMVFVAFCAVFVASGFSRMSVLHAQVSVDRILRAVSEPHNWLTYGGTYDSQRFSRLTQVTPANVTRLEQKWVLQDAVFGAW